MKGVDYAWHGQVPYDELKRRGFEFAMRYVSHDPGKDLTTAEKRELFKRGISVGLVFESTARRALTGHAGGVADAINAKARATDLGLPNIPVYFAVDWDASNTDMPAIAAYLQGAASVLGHDRVGVYGGYHVINYMHDHNACAWFWQTYAWSQGLVHLGAHIYQHKNGVTIGGLSCDLNRALKPDIGVRGPAPQHPPKPTGYRVTIDGHNPFVTRFPAAALARWGVAIHKPRSILIERL